MLGAYVLALAGFKPGAGCYTPSEPSGPRFNRNPLPHQGSKECARRRKRLERAKGLDT